MYRLPLALPAASLAASASAGTPVYNANISEAEVLDAQTAWRNALIEISKTGEAKGHAAARQLASEVIDAAYGYNLGIANMARTIEEAERPGGDLPPAEQWRTVLLGFDELAGRDMRELPRPVNNACTIGAIEGTSDLIFASGIDDRYAGE